MIRSLGLLGWYWDGDGDRDGDRDRQRDDDRIRHQDGGLGQEGAEGGESKVHHGGHGDGAPWHHAEGG